MALRIASSKRLGDVHMNILKAALEQSDRQDDKYDIGFDALTVPDPEIALQMQIDGLCERWQALDSKYLLVGNMNKSQHLNILSAEDEKKVRGCFTHLAVPIGNWYPDLRHPERCSIDDPSATHPRIPEEFRVCVIITFRISPCIFNLTQCINPL